MKHQQTTSQWRLVAGDDWQLGSEPRVNDADLSIEAESKILLEAQSLDRVVHVVTVESLAWSGIALWTIATRLVGLGVVPLSAHEARHALFQYDLVNRTNWAAAAGFHPTSGAWMHLLEAALFATVGTNDSAARLGFALAGILLVAMIALMRRFIGRAGSIGAATLVAISPTFTFFSRSSSTAIVVATLTLASFVAFITLVHKPRLLPSTCLGVAAGLLCETSAAGIATGGILIAGLMLLGVFLMMVLERPLLELRVWLGRYASFILTAGVTAAVSWFLPHALLFKIADIYQSLRELSAGFSAHSYFKGVEFYAPGLLLYEFSLIAAAIVGLVVTIFSVPRSRLAFYLPCWTLLTLAFFVGSHTREPDRLVILLVPMVMLGGSGIEYLYRSRAWRFARYFVLILGGITVYCQIAASFIYPAPAANRLGHANLYWTDGATLLAARTQLRAIRTRFPSQGGTVFMQGSWPPCLRWYLRDFRPATSSKSADLVVYSNPPASLSEPDFNDVSSLDLQTAWQPTLHTLNPARAFRFVFFAEPWLELQTTTVWVVVHAPADVTPTLVIPPN